MDFSGEKIFYSIEDVKILEERADSSNCESMGSSYELDVGGEYNIENSLSAIRTGLELGLTVQEIQAGLKKYSPIEKRWEAVTAGGYRVINDSYNANPESMRAFVDTVLGLYRDYVLVLGDMGELGVNEVQYHRELGKYINNHSNLDKNAVVLSIGQLAKNITDEITVCKAVHFENIEQSVDYIENSIGKEMTLFLKASRSMKFENIIKELNSFKQ